MNPENAVVESINTENTPESVLRARHAWRQLGVRMRSITPAGLVRFLLTVAALVFIAWLIGKIWIALVPFAIGAVIAYAVLPLVNWLDRFLPRFVAVLLVMLLVLVLIVLFLALLVPILAEQLYFVYQSLPGLAELREYGQQVREYVRTLPEPTQQTIDNVYDQAAVRVQENLNLYLSGLVTLAISTVLSLVNAVGFILGFLVVPTWLLTVLTEQQNGRRAIDRLLPGWLRADFWAVIRIFDRALGAFIRGQLLVGFVTALLVYGGLEVMTRVAGTQGSVRIQLLLAMFAGLMQLIPSIGPFLGAIPGLLIGLTISTQSTLLILGLYVVVQLLVTNFVIPRVERSVVDVHSAVLILIVVGLSQLGFWWVLLAAPVTAILRDLFRYVYGRFGSPPRPAGLLPHEPLPQPIQPPLSAARRRMLVLSARRPR